MFGTKKRVVITGAGIISSIGNTVAEVQNALINSTSGIIFNQEFEKKGLSSHISGQLPDALALLKGQKLNGHTIPRFMSPGAAYSFLAMQQAVADTDLPQEIMKSPRTGLFVGTGGGSPISSIDVGNTLDAPDKGIKRVSGFSTVKCMSNCPSANLSTLFGIQGSSYSVSSACASSAHAIGIGCKDIALGLLDVVFCGACDERDPYVAAAFDRIKALSTLNSDPTTASRPYDVARDGFVISGGSGILVLEELEHARKRGAKIYAEIIGYGDSSDGSHMTTPSGDGAARCMQIALDRAPGLRPEDITYINTHGTSTPKGDITELLAIREVFGDTMPHISSTKGLTGHGLGAAGAQELIYSLLMMENRFIAPCVNITNLDPNTEGFPLVRDRIDDVEVKTVMSNSFGFGGTNATLIIKKWD